jgi:galactokinase
MRRKDTEPGVLRPVAQLREALASGGGRAELERLYGPGEAPAARQRFLRLLERHALGFPGDWRAALFSVPGRTEIGGNHTDHNSGRVLAAAVDLDIIASACPGAEPVARIDSEGYERQVVDLDRLEARESERFQPAALVRGLASRLSELGWRIGGFQACLSSRVLKGSGLSSSAAYEVAIGTILNQLYNGGSIPAVELAKACRYAENHYYGKPCGLMDQTTCAVGGFVAIDFADMANPRVEKVELDFAATGMSLVIVDTGGHHAGLTGDYAAIEREMKETARALGAETLRGTSRERLLAEAPRLRAEVGDRAILRSLHFFDDDRRAAAQAAALRRGEVAEFLRLVGESGASSWMLLQNCYPPEATRDQGITLALAVSRELLGGQGACRVHGGGFAGTIQAFVPEGLLPAYLARMGELFGPDSCHPLRVRQAGATAVDFSG